ncbi:Transmembrane channel-like protein 5 [Liparis tanakae]|uniref:Transmembrane channel-like protein 5 n=1 Tax=Liparis tanakae TaxID=230148 RepID=A0A4Z2HDP9_9TELE|nr:Transmembrane channel-like protein 5 [Liparis tanakae]
MTSYRSEGFFNTAYHDSETLEINSKTPHTNPYARGGGPTGRDVARGGPSGGWRGRESIPMGLVSTREQDLDHSMFQIPHESQYDQSPSVRLPSATSGNMTMRWRGRAMRRMSMFPDGDAAHAAFTEDAIRNEMENEEQNLVKELVALSTRDRIHAIRDLPISFDEKIHIRSQVLAFKSSRKSRQFTCFSDFSENVSLSFRRCGYGLRSARQTLELWQGIMKEIGGKFGSSVLIYFVFLKWLLVFNIFSFLVNFGLITIPVLVYDHSPSIPPNVSFRGLEILSGAGYFEYTVMYYGGYSNETLHGLMDYNMQLAYFFTIAVYMVLCGVTLIFSMDSSFKKNYVLADPTSNSAWQLLCSWDFSVTNERAVRQRKNNLRVQLQESLSERAQRDLLTFSEKLKHFGVYLGSWLLSTGLAVGCAASIYYLCQYEQQFSQQRPDDLSSAGPSNSNVMVQALLARQQLDQRDQRRGGGGGVPPDASASSALIQAMLARQRAEDEDEEGRSSSSGALAQASRARQRAEGGERDERRGAARDLPSSVSSVMTQVMRARQRAEEEEEEEQEGLKPVLKG